MHILFRTSFLLSSLLLITTANAQVNPEAQPNANTPVYKLKIKPKAEPSPALRYTLYPEVRTQVNGNAAQGYYRAFSPDWMSYRNDKEYPKKYEKWLSVPLKELDEKEIIIPQESMLPVPFSIQLSLHPTNLIGPAAPSWAMPCVCQNRYHHTNPFR